MPPATRKCPTLITSPSVTRRKAASMHVPLPSVAAFAATRPANAASTSCAANVCSTTLSPSSFCLCLALLQYVFSSHRYVCFLIMVKIM
eukprot:c3246_g1_i1 orf=94-360(+)